MVLLDTAAKAVYTLPPDKLAKAIHLYHARTLAHFGDTAWMILALWLLVRSGVGAPKSGKEKVASIEFLKGAARISRSSKEQFWVSVHEQRCEKAQQGLRRSCFSVHESEEIMLHHASLAGAN